MPQAPAQVAGSISTSPTKPRSAPARAARGAFGPDRRSSSTMPARRRARRSRRPIRRSGPGCSRSTSPALFWSPGQSLPDMKARGAGARLINIASTAGLVGYAYVSAYCAAKHGVIGLTRSAGARIRQRRNHRQRRLPRLHRDAAVGRAPSKTSSRRPAEPRRGPGGAGQSNPQGRLVTPEEVADAVLWLASPGAPSINGQAIVVAGGEVMVG